MSHLRKLQKDPLKYERRDRRRQEKRWKDCKKDGERNERRKKWGTKMSKSWGMQTQEENIWNMERKKWKMIRKG